MPIHAILFDWGDTVMRAFPAARGPMHTWKQVEAMPGIAPTLASLVPDYTLCLATNAADSSPAQVRLALARVGLQDHFTHNFTAGSLGYAKPQPQFFAAVLEQLSLSPAEVVMVGDSLEADVFGAANAGLRAIWLSPDPHTPVRRHPLQDAEIYDAAMLPPAIANLVARPLPGLEECLRLMNQYAPDPGLQRHMRVVALTAYFTARLLAANGQAVDPILAHRGALLHDLDKLRTVRTNRRHGEEAAGILTELGYPALAPLVRSHPAFSVLDPAVTPVTLEQKLVYLADKMCESGRVVTVDTRLAHLRERYPADARLFDEAEPLIHALEQEITLLAGLGKKKLQDYLQRKVNLIP